MTDKKIKYHPQTVKTVLSVIQKEHDAESDRIKFTTTKVQVMLTTSSILLTAIIFLLQAIGEKKAFVTISSSPSNSIALYASVILSIAILTVITAIIIFLYVLGTKNYRRINFGELVYDKELSKEPEKVEASLIATYEEALKGNIPVADRMLFFYQIGSSLVMSASVMLFIVTANALL